MRNSLRTPQSRGPSKIGKETILWFLHMLSATNTVVIYSTVEDAVQCFVRDLAVIWLS